MFEVKHRSIFFLFLIISVPSFCQNKNFFDYNDGLSNSLINQLYQDQYGFIWAATEDGLDRFDGLEFYSFSEEDNNLNANFVTSILEDSKGRIWIGEFNGLQTYNYSTESFTEFPIYIEDKQIHPFISSLLEAANGDIWIATSGFGLIQIDHETGRAKYSTKLNRQFCSLYLQTIFEDRDGTLWIGSVDDGLNSFNPISGEVITYNTSGDDSSFPGNDITAICEDHLGYLYIATLTGGISRLDKVSGKFEYLKKPDSQSINIPVKALLHDSKNRLWIGTDGHGLMKYNYALEKIERYSPSSSPFDFSKSKVHSIIEDRSGNIWLGIFHKGLFVFPESKGQFTNYGYKAFGEGSIGSSSITAIAGDENLLYIGTDGDGLYQLNQKSKEVKHLSLNKQMESINNSILSLNFEEKGILWIGTFSNGLIRYNTQTNESKSFIHIAGDHTSLQNDKISCIIKEKNGNYLLGSQGAGVIRLNTKRESFSTHFLDNDSLNILIPKWVNDIHIDNQEAYWIGTYDGLVYINPQRDSLHLITVDDGILPSNVIYCIHSDHEHNIWVGTYKGLVKITHSNMHFRTFTKADGLADNVICAIEEDASKQLWLSTHKGLSSINPISYEITNFQAVDGLQSNEFSKNAVYKSNEQELFFGGINGITQIQKEYTNNNIETPEVMFTEFQRFHKKVLIGEQSEKHTILSKSLSLTDSIHLREEDNMFSIHFSSSEVAKQSSIKYEYFMEGFDSKWNNSSSFNRSATYTNLSHGTYIFHVRSVDKQAYSSPKSLTIIIHPPWYKSTLAIILWIILIISSIYFVFIFINGKYKGLEAERLNEKKMQFFINISHEIRTPLSLILDPLDRLRSETKDPEKNKLFAIMHQNANRIFSLTNQLLDVRKIDKGRMLVKYQKTNLSHFLNNISQSYLYMASERNISFNFTSESDDIYAWIDPLNFEKVILNLLSNAFKFTKENGKITVELSSSEERAQIIVNDSGIGIKKAELEHIFDRFYQIDSKENRSSAGTGIGLHLSRSLVEIHGGSLHAENMGEGNGSRFVVQIPLGNNHLPKKDLLTEENYIPTTLKSFHSPKSVDTSLNVRQTQGSKEKLLIVDDEFEIRDYLKSSLSDEYEITLCENGKIAHEMLESLKPELIISDIMMPEMDGITFCKLVKGNMETSHIPIILLTALSKEEDKVEGIDTGADLYLIKPFNTVFLKKSISNLLDNRKKILANAENNKEKYALDPIEIQSHDEILMQKVMTIIKENIGSNQLNVEMLAEGVGISRVHMHRKLKELTNQSSRDFIRNIRMKQAAYTFTNKKLTISEVAFSLGYSSLSHFSSSFKSFYGISPKEFIEQQNKPD